MRHDSFGLAMSVDIITHACKQKFIHCSVATRLEILLPHLRKMLGSRYGPVGTRFLILCCVLQRDVFRRNLVQAKKSRK